MSQYWNVIRESSLAGNDILEDLTDGEFSHSLGPLRTLATTSVAAVRLPESRHSYNSQHLGGTG